MAEEKKTKTTEKEETKKPVKQTKPKTDTKKKQPVKKTEAKKAPAKKTQAKPKPKTTTAKKPATKKAPAKKKVEPKKAPVKKDEKSEKKEEPKEEKKEEEKYQVKKKPEISKDIKAKLETRKEIKKRTPEFLREEWFRYKKIPRNWRRPDGITSKMRRNFKYRPSKVRVGFRGPSDVRGLHSSGFEEVMIYNINDLSGLDAKTQAARIGATVGTKKRMAIEKKAKELDIRILNL